MTNLEKELIENLLKSLSEYVLKLLESNISNDKK